MGIVNFIDVIILSALFLILIIYSYGPFILNGNEFKNSNEGLVLTCCIRRELIPLISSGYPFMLRLLLGDQQPEDVHLKALAKACEDIDVKTAQESLRNIRKVEMLTHYLGSKQNFEMIEFILLLDIELDPTVDRLAVAFLVDYLSSEWTEDDLRSAAKYFQKESERAKLDVPLSPTKRVKPLRGKISKSVKEGAKDMNHKKIDNLLKVFVKFKNFSKKFDQSENRESYLVDKEVFLNSKDSIIQRSVLNAADTVFKLYEWKKEKKEES